MSKTRYNLDLVFANVFFGANFSFYVSLTRNYLDFQQIFMLQVLSAAVFFIPFALFSKQSFRITWRDAGNILIVTLLIVYGWMYMLLWGSSYTTPIDASIIATLGPILVLVISVFFLIDRFTPMKIVGMVIGLAGALVVILSNSGTTAATAKLGGDAIVFLGIVSSSFSMVWLKDLIMRYKPITLLRWMYPLAALMLLPFGLSSVIHTDFAAIPPHIWWVIAYAVLLPSFGPNYLLIFSLHYVKPTISSVYFYLQPVIATGLSVALGMDKLSWDRGLASIAVFVGVLLVVNAYKNHPSAPRHGGEGTRRQNRFRIIPGYY